MKRRLLRIENLLLLCPILMSASFDLYLNNSGLDISNPYALSTIRGDTLELLFYLYIILVPCFLLHWLLRTSRMRKRQFCNPHVIITCAMILAAPLFFNYGAYTESPAKIATTATGIVGFITVNRFQLFSVIPFIFIQVAFITYAVLLLLHSKRDPIKRKQRKRRRARQRMRRQF